MIIDVPGGRAPYPPSWIDRLTLWVRGLPSPAWGFYLALALLLELLAVACLGLGGMLRNQGALIFYTWLALTLAYLVALVHYLDNWAEAALARYRPVMTADEPTYERLRYQLTTLPSRSTLAASALGVLYGVGMLTWHSLTDADPVIGVFHPAVIALDISYRVLVYLLAATVVFHTFHQLRTVNAIYTEHTRINLFQLGPLYALSGLAARGAIGIGLPTYLWLPAPVSPNQALGIQDFFPTIFLAGVIVITFIWPLWGAHRLLERGKQRLQDEAGRRFDSTMAELNGKIDRGDMEHRTALVETLDGLSTEQGAIDKLRTWPWRAGTVSGIAIAIAAPLLIWLIQRLLERLGV